MASCEECRYWRVGPSQFANKVGFRQCQRMQTFKQVEESIPPAARNNKQASDEGRLNYWSEAKVRASGTGAFVDTEVQGALYTDPKFVCGRFMK